MLNGSRKFIGIARDAQSFPRRVFERQIYRSLSSASPLTEESHYTEEDEQDNILEEGKLRRTSWPRSFRNGDTLNSCQLSDNESATDCSPAMLTYTGDNTIPITSLLHIFGSKESAPRGCWPVFRLMDENGIFRDGMSDGFKFKIPKYEMYTERTSSNLSLKKEPMAKGHDLCRLKESLKQLYPFQINEFDRNYLFSPARYSYQDTNSDDTLLRCYTLMVRLREMDLILQNAQRQGRISFYLSCRGEEAIHMGAASALELDDVVFAQYREAGLLMWRGFTLEQFTDQCFSNEADLGKGRQMPIHYGSRALNYQTISSPLGTQIPQSVGAAYHLKHTGKNAVSICFFGDGCTSTPDFHSGLNFAATLKAPVIFFCRNNGYAISTPVSEQYNGDGIISRAPGYGMAAIRVDGNDVFAINAAVRESRKYALKHGEPVLIEAMTYRQGHHSTSDDSSRYRNAREVQNVADKNDPLSRFQTFLSRHTTMTDDDFKNVEEKERLNIIAAMKKSEAKPPPPLKDLFEEVYDEMPPSLIEQQLQLMRHLQKHPNHYDTEKN